MRATRHNGRAGKNGVYTDKHNDRNFDTSHADHINPSRSCLNVYWDIENGRRTGERSVYEDEEGNILPFSQVEANFYEKQYSGYIEGQKARNAKSRHKKRDRTTEDIRHNRKTCPEETIYQFGCNGSGATSEQLMAIVMEFMDWFTEQYGERVHIIDWAMHLDERTAHIQERHVFDCINEYGEIEPQQERALEQLGIPLPNPEKEQGRNNNRKMTFDAVNRQKLIEIAKEHGLEIEEEVKYGGRPYLEKQDYIIQKQQETMAEQAAVITQQQTVITEQQAVITAKDAELERKNEALSEKDEALAEKEAMLKEKDEALKEKDSTIAAKDAELDEKLLRLSDVDALVEQVGDICYEKAVTVGIVAAANEAKKRLEAAIDHLVKKTDARNSGLGFVTKGPVVTWLEMARDSLQKALATLTADIVDKLLNTATRKAAKQKIVEKAKPAVVEVLRPRMREEAERKTKRREGQER